MLFYILASIIVSASVVLMTRMRGDMGEAAYYGDTSSLVRLLLILTGIAAVRAVFAALSAFFSWRFSGNAGFKLRHSFINYFLRIPFSKFEKAGSGESLSIYTNDVPRAEDFIGAWGLMSLISEIIMMAAAVGALIFMFNTGIIFALILLGVFAMIVLVQIVCSRPIQKKNIVVSEETANFNAVVNDSLQNISVIAAYGLEDTLEERYLTQYDKYMAAVKSQIMALLPLVSVGILTTIIPFAVIAIVAAMSVLDGSMTIADFIAYTAMLVVVGDYLAGLSETLGSVQSDAAGVKRLLTSTAELPEDLDSGEMVAKDALTISFDNVSFSYGEDLPLVLEDVNFEITPGSRVAFVGGSGSGKSTILKLILGLYEPTNGIISLGGRCTTGLSRSSIRGALAYLPQDSFLFPESIRDNITLGTGSYDTIKLEKACADAGILDFINNLPEGFNSVLSESAENISGGQRQRIAMARAFYKDSPVILFDEATSALDPATEAAILDSFNDVVKDKTVIMVAHRTKVIAACDTIIVMDNGKVSGIGRHDELLTTNDVYRSLYESRQQEESGEVL
ncbi:MAG: ABC transporter ATP-binding protein/permease [Defluviitaleaceae bacterium]|nr:ABC transporter ATP-binding protein/permease [Defluviitaleaceae bacterium]